MHFQFWHKNSQMALNSLLDKNWNFYAVCIAFNYVSLAMRHQQIEKVHQEDRIRFRARTGFDPDQQKNHSFSGSQLMIKPTLEFAYLAKGSSFRLVTLFPDS